MNKVTLLLFTLLSFSTLRAENYGIDFVSGGLRGGVDTLSVADSPSKFRMYKLIAPSSPLVLGALTLYVSSADELDMSWSDHISSGHGKLHFDDYLQYSPVVIMWCLDAFGRKIPPTHKFKQQTTILALSATISISLVQGTKYFVNRSRPDTGASNSFPSGHTATAFLCAEMLHQEFGHHSPWISVAGYSIAAVTGYMRIYNERHYIGDVIAGAGFGMLSARVAYWVAPYINRALWGSETGYKESKYVTSLMPSLTGDSLGVALSVTF